MEGLFRLSHGNPRMISSFPMDVTNNLVASGSSPANKNAMTYPVILFDLLSVPSTFLTVIGCCNSCCDNWCLSTTVKPQSSGGVGIDCRL